MSEVAEAMEIGGDERSAIGATRVANDVVAWIAALTALQVRGVHAMYRPSGQSIDRILRRRVAHRGARVELRDDGLLIDLWIVMEAGTNVAAVGAEVQASVGETIRRMLGLPLAAVNVFISEVVFT
ncbi:MAG: Asp23/Gls24 family envelope stress response protein [Candidatus Dormibacteraeota bacterium]|uniref:Asp23/Gls24 family envelope stress response protein n=1 Tax=Candidatus Amunia macphersoniae TaxID=3127014 RepID=A0A934NH81_9BACT|nr:Asp23/Gls24 family envelope stress response protein [Candidatus Dormibacteraeota bacterium]